MCHRYTQKRWGLVAHLVMGYCVQQKESVAHTNLMVLKDGTRAVLDSGISWSRAGLATQRWKRMEVSQQSPYLWVDSTPKTVLVRILIIQMHFKTLHIRANLHRSDTHTRTHSQGCERLRALYGLYPAVSPVLLEVLHTPTHMLSLFTFTQTYA